MHTLPGAASSSERVRLAQLIEAGLVLMSTGISASGWKVTIMRRYSGHPRHGVAETRTVRVRRKFDEELVRTRDDR